VGKMAAVAVRVLSVIVNYNGGAMVRDAVASLVGQTLPTDVLLVDNDSRDGSVEPIEREFPGVIVRRTGANLGAVAQNALLDFPGYEYYFIFNPDAFAEPDALERLVALMDRDPQLAMLGATLVEHDRPEQVQSFAKTIDPLAFPYDPLEEQPVSKLPDHDLVDCFYATSAAALVNAGAFRALNGVDESFFMFTDETDLAWRMRLRGLRVAVTPRVLVRHVGGGSAPVGREGAAYRTSLRRIYLRERNCMAMCCKCYGALALALYLPVNLLSLVAEGTVLALLGRPEFLRSYAEAVRDVWKMRRGVMASRRAVQQTRRISDVAVFRAMFHGSAKLHALLRRGIPKLTDFARRPAAGSPP
jgi:GT2 family glycosyltransferase